MSSSLYSRIRKSSLRTVAKKFARLPLLFFALTVILGAQALMQGANADLNDGLVAHFPLDGDVNDATLNGHDAAISGTPAFTADRSGNGDSAFDFDNFVGTVSGNSYASLPLGNSSRTIAAWVKTPGVPRDMGIFHYGSQGGAGDFHLYVSGANTVGIGNGYGFGVVTGSTLINDSEWHHIAGTYDQATGQLAVYVDGVLDNQGPISSPPNTGTAHPWEIGRFANSFGWTFDGVIDDLRVYDRTLSDAELAQLSELDLSIKTAFSTVIGGVPTSIQFEAHGGTPPYAWSIVSGQLPVGLELAPSGVLSGTATEAGKYIFTVQVADDTGETANRAYELTVRAEGAFDLAAEWSDAQNPNGPWSYNGSPGTPLATHWDNWDPTSGCCFGPPQPAWAAAQWPNSGHVPAWMKVAADTTAVRDFPKGRVITHGPSEVTWTSPIDGVVTIAGGVWQIDVTASRNMDWVLSLNGSRLTGGSLTPDNPYSSIAPFKFKDGSDGPGVLTQSVKVGDVISLDLRSNSTFNSFVGVDFSIFSSFEIVTTIPSAIKLGEPFSQQLDTVAGLHPVSWSVAGGTLPLGMDLSANGVFSGTPTELVNTTFSLAVLDASGGTTEKEFTVDVVLVPPPPDVRVSKTGVTTVPGRTLTYYIAVENVGDAIATNIPIIEILEPHQVSLVSVTPDSELDLEAINESSIIPWIIPKLEPRKSVVLSYKVVLKPTVSIGTPVNGEVCSSIKLGDRVADCLSKLILTVGACAICSVPCSTVASCGTFVTCLPALSICTGCLIGGPGPDGLPSGCLPSSAGVISCFKQVSDDCSADKQVASGPIDPNEKLVTPQGFIQPDQTLTYPIHFENIGDIEALDVFVTDVLDDNLDISTLKILTPDGASFDPSTRTLRWDLLGRNLQPGETGNVLLSVKPLPGLPSGTVIRNEAEIQFEIFDILVTPEVVNVIDTTSPECVIDPLPAVTAATEFQIAWTGTDAIGEIEGQSVFVSVDGGTYAPFLEDTLETSAAFVGEFGKTYEFLCVAKDTAGNIEEQDLLAEAATTLLANRPPVADANVDQTLECTGAAGAAVTLDGSGSADPDNDALTYAWSGPFAAPLPGQVVNVALPLGAHTITLTVDDGKGGVDSDDVQVVVQDTVAPSLSATLSPNVLWPPNHKFVAIGADVTASDVCDPNPTVLLSSITMNEGDETNTYDPNYDVTTGDGNTVDDIQVDEAGNISLRAERSGLGSGRVYNHIYAATDASGNSASESAAVTVPHSQ